MTGWMKVMGAAVVCAGAAQALTIDKIMRTGTTTAEAVLSYDELATDQSVVFAWGSSDGGANYTAWPNAVAGTGCAGAGSRTCRVKLPKGAADAANLRAFLVPASYYASYLRGYGNRYIVTDYYANKNSAFFADFQMFDVTTAQQRVFGSPNSCGLVAQAYINGSFGWSWSFSHAGNWTASGAFPGVLATLDRTTVLLDAYSNNNAGQYVLTINGVQKYSCTLTSGSAPSGRTATASQPLLIYYDTVDKIANMRLYGLTCSDAGTVVRNFQPYVRNGVACVYDSITDKYFYPEGSGEPMDAGAPADPGCVSASSATVSPTAMLAGPVVTSAAGVFDETSPSAALGFAASGSARELWFAWTEDDADKGTTFSAWPFNERIATVAANVAYGRYAIPPSARKAKKGRFFLLAPGGTYDCTYIRAYGLQGIDTGVKAGTNVAVTVDFQLDYTDLVQQRVFGVGDSTFTMAAYINGSGKWAWGAKDSSGNWTSTDVVSDRSRTQITIDCPNNLYRLVMDGVTRKTTAISSIVAASNFTNTAGWTIALLCYRSHATNKSFAQKAFARLYGAELSDNGTVVRRMTPCVKDGVAMMHDEINNVDYGNCVTNLNTQFIPGGRLDSPAGAVAGELLDFAEAGVGKVPDDVYADATMLWRGRRSDANGDGIVDNNEMLDTFGRTPYTTTARGSAGYKIVHSNELASLPGRGVERQINTIHLPQTLILTNEAQTLGYSYPSTVQFDNLLDGFDDHYTVMARVRPDMLEKPASTSQWLLNIGHGGGKGILFGFSGSGAHSRSTSILVGGSGLSDISNAILTNGWVDVAVVADGRRVSTFVVRDWRQTGDSTGFTQYWTGRVPETKGIAPNGKWMILGSETTSTGPYAYPTPSGTTVNAVKAFRGSVAQLAVWPRALSKAELFAACGWPKQDLWRVGVDDGSDAEFTSGTQSETFAPDDAEWPLKEGLAANGSVTFKFPLWKDYEDQIGQVIRWKGLSSSASGFVQASVNGQKIKTLRVGAGRWTQWFVPPNCFVAGTNTLTLTRTDNGSGRLRADVVAFGGGWQLASRNKSHSEFGHESYGLHDFWASDGNLRDVQRVIYCARNTARTNACYHVHMPAEMAGVYRWKLRVGLGGCNLPASDVIMNVDLNGVQKLSTKVVSSEEYSFLIDPEELPEGDNVFNFQNTSGNTGTHYIMLDMMSLEPLRPSDGTFMFVR